MGDFPPALRAFDVHLQAIGRAEHTRSTYRYELTRFWCDWCVPRGTDVMDIPQAEIEGYLASLPIRGSKRGDSSRALKAFYGWLAPRLGVPNPTAEVKIPRSRMGPAPSISQTDVRRLLRAAFGRDARRGWAIMLCLATGARIGSLAAVMPVDVDIDREWITFTVTKGDRPYGLPLNRQGVVAATHLLAGMKSGMKSPGESTLIGVGAPGFRAWVHTAERDAGLGRIWPHLLRHEFSNRVAAHGDPEAWRRAMNHADLSQWARYVAVNDERLRAALTP